MPSKRFNNWVKYFEAVTAAHEMSNQASAANQEVPIIPLLAQMAAERKGPNEKLRFIEKVQATRGNGDELMAMVINDPDIRSFIDMVVSDMLAECGPPPKKTDRKALKALEAGMKCLDEKKFDDALIWYSKAVHCAPHDHSGPGGLADCYSKRAMAFLCCGQPAQGVLDAIDALRLGKFTRLERLHVLNCIEQALRSMNMDRQADILEDLIAELKRQKTQNENQKIIDTLRSFKFHKREMNCDADNFEADNAQMENCSRFVRMDVDDVKGRMMVAAQDIRAGELIVMEDSFIHRLDYKSKNDHCSHCLKIHLGRSVPCKNCEHDGYCSHECADAAAAYHKYECGYGEALRYCAANHDAIRLFGEYGVDQILDMDANPIPMAEWKTKPFNHDLVSFMSLMGHDSSSGTPEMYFSHTFSSCVSCVLAAKLGIVDINDQETFRRFCGAFQRINKRVRTNAWAIYDDMDGQLKRCGSGVYLALSMFNHSCKPNCSQEYRGRTMAVSAKRAIKRGEEVTMSYGPMLGVKPVNERRAHLKRGYNFECECDACMTEYESIQMQYEHPPAAPPAQVLNSAMNARGMPAMMPMSQGMPGQYPLMPGQMPVMPGQMPGMPGQMPSAPGQMPVGFMPMPGQHMYGPQMPMMPGQQMPMMTGQQMPAPQQNQKPQSVADNDDFFNSIKSQLTGTFNTSNTRC